MTSLKVYLDYDTTYSRQSLREGSLGYALPVKVLDVQGTILAEELATTNQPAEFKLTVEYETVFVRLTWPSGKSETKKVDLLPTVSTSVTFSDNKIAQNEWSAWAIPRLSPLTSMATSNRSRDMHIERYANVWLRVWCFDNGQWSLKPMTPRMQYKSEVARQIDLDLEAKPHLLQVGGSDVPWRFVALPGAGPCRILITPTYSNDPRTDPLKVVVTSFRSDAETLLEFLARDSIRAANTMANSQKMAVTLFEKKFTDPIAAVAGAYYLLRIDDWDRVPLGWWENLSNNFTWIPDTAILHCVRLLRAGLKDEWARTEVLDLFKACLDRGWPLYDEGLQLLQEAGSLLRQIASWQDAEYFAKVETLATAKKWAGAALSFTGRDPAKPSAVLWVGMPNAPRRRHHAQHEWSDDISSELPRDLQGNNMLFAFKNEEDVTLSEVSRLMSSLSFAQEFAPKKKAAISYDRAAGADGKSLTYKEEGNVVRTTRTKKIKESGWLLLGDIGS